MHLNLRFLYLGSGIFVSYGVYGVLQEKVFKSSYGDGEKYTYVLSLLFLQTVVNYLYAYINSSRDKDRPVDKTPLLYYVCCSLTYLLAMASSFTALQWVSYPAQIVAKSSKPIPVMIMGVLIGNKVFPVRKYFIVLLIVIGGALFMYKDGKSSDTSNVGVGEMLLICSLAMDGLTNSLQERIMSNYNPSSNDMMACMNKFSSLFLGATILITGEIFSFTFFVNKYPSVLWDVGLLCITSAIGQYFIYKMITEFDTLTCSIITTTRKFFSVLGSIIIFGNVLLPRQWFAVFCVFSGLILDAKYGKSPKRAKVVAS